MAFLDNYLGGFLFDYYWATTSKSRLDILVNILADRCGFPLFDRVSDSVAVFKAQDFPGAIPVFIHFTFESSGTGVRIRFYLHWNASTHVGSQQITSTRMTDNSMSYPEHIYAGKGCFYIIRGDNGVPSNDKAHYVGFFSGEYASGLQKFGTNSTADISSGTDVEIPVLDSSGFVVGTTVMVGGTLASEGRCVTVVKSKREGFVTLGSLDKSFVSGFYICTPPTFCYTDYNGAFPFFSKNHLSAANIAWSSLGGNLFRQSADGFNQETGKYNTSICRAYSTGLFSANLPPDMFLLGNFTLSCNDFVCVMQDEFAPVVSGVLTGSSSLEVSDSSKSFSGLENKYLVVYNGTGAGQARRIVSSSGSVITVDRPFSTIPAAGANYCVCDAAYRCMSETSHFIREL